MEKKVYIPGTYGQSTTEIRIPMVNDLVQRLAGALSVHLPQIHCPPYPKGNQDVAQRNSTLREKWTTAVLKELESQANRRIFATFMDHLCGDGHAVLKLIHRNDFWANYPQLNQAILEGGEASMADGLTLEQTRDHKDKVFNFKAGSPIPLQLSAPDPLTCYAFFSDRGLEDVFQADKRPRYHVAKRFNVSFDSNGNPIAMGEGSDKDSVGSLVGEVEYWEHWTPDDVAYFVNRKCVEIVRHNMGWIPYWFAMGTETSSSDPEKAGLPLAYGMRYLVPALDSLLTMKTNSGFLQSYPSFKRTRPLGAPSRIAEEGEDEDDDDAVEFEPGHIYDGLGGEDLEVIQIPPVGADVNESINALMGIADKTGVPSLLSGQNSPNRVSGAAYSEMLNVSRTKYTPIIRNASRAYEGLIRGLWWYLENRIKEDLPVWGSDGKQERWLPLGPADINNYYAVNVVVEPILPQDDVTQGQHALSLVEGKLISKRYAREEKLGIENPEEMDDEVLVEEAMELPEVKIWLIMKALERYNLDELKEIFQTTTDMAEQGIAQLAQGGGTGPGREGMPNLAPGAGGPMMPGAGGMLSGGQTKEQPPRPPASLG